MGEGNDVGGTAAAIAHHHWDGRLISQALQHDGDDIGTSLHYQTHQRDPLSQTWGTQPANISHRRSLNKSPLAASEWEEVMSVVTAEHPFAVPALSKLQA